MSNARGKWEESLSQLVALTTTQNQLLEKILAALDKSPEQNSEKEILDLAKTLVWKNAREGTLSHARIAEQLTAMTGRKIHRTGLTRNKFFAEYRAVYDQIVSAGQDSIPRGHHTDDGDLEAYE